jgi:intracellular sulfur oxidation DsrE/DsrF family protein
MKINKRGFITAIALMSAVAFFGCNKADTSAMSGTKNKIAIQVSTNDPLTQKIALNNAVNVQKALGIDNVDIEIVAYGPGLSMLTQSDKNAEAARVKSLALQNITFSACANTMKGIEKRTGKKPVLIEGVRVVPAGVIRLMELQQQGYAYIRP